MNTAGQHNNILQLKVELAGEQTMFSLNINSGLNLFNARLFDNTFKKTKAMPFSPTAGIKETPVTKMVNSQFQTTLRIAE